MGVWRGGVFGGVYGVGGEDLGYEIFCGPGNFFWRKSFENFFRNFFPEKLF
jgi:hypothetical protein